MKYLSLILFCLFVATGFSQRTSNHLHLEGIVMGYDYDPSKGLFKKEKVELQGSLSNVKITAKKGSSSISSQTTDKGGAFAMKLPLGELYTIHYSKSGYGKSAVELDLRKIPTDMAKTGLRLTNIELILNDNETDKPVDNGTPFGKIYYNSGARVFEFKEAVFDDKKKLFKKGQTNTPVNLITASLSKNREMNKEPLSPEEELSIGESPSSSSSHSISSPTTEEETSEGEIQAKVLHVLTETTVSDISNWSTLTQDDIENRTKEIADAWDQLEKDKMVAVTAEDFLIIQAKEQLLIAAEKELEAAKSYIAEQEEKLSAQKNLSFALLGIVLLLVGFVFILVKSIRDKKKSNFELEKRNKKILSSIQYAERIQKSVLLKEDQIKTMLPDSFVFHKPLDVVSGDFYWFSEINNKVVVAAIDCTGHGVPGAFMSLIGNTLMNQIVNEKGILKPGEILKELHEGVVDSLNQQEDEDAAQDGMDMAVCVIDKHSKEVAYSGAMNPIYCIQNGEFKELSANLRGVGGVLRRRKKREVIFEEDTIQLSKGDAIYLFSDGYMDQFGGTNNEKFNISRFRELLLAIYELPVDHQHKRIEDEMNQWKKDKKQVDDMLVIGAKF